MKKTYIKPEIVSFDVEVEQLMAASSIAFGDDDNGNGGFVDGKVDSNLSKGHKFDLWADDEED